MREKEREIKTDTCFPSAFLTAAVKASSSHNFDPGTVETYTHTHTHTHTHTLNIFPLDQTHQIFKNTFNYRVFNLFLQVVHDRTVSPRHFDKSQVLFDIVFPEFEYVCDSLPLSLDIHEVGLKRARE